MTTETAAQLTTEEQVQQLVGGLFNPDNIVEMRCCLRGTKDAKSYFAKASDFKTLLAWARKMNGAAYDVYFGANPRARAGGTKATDVLHCAVVFADLENIGPDDALARIAAAALPMPTAVVDSGHGVHVYWLLTESVPTSEGEQWRNIQDDLAAMLNSDPMVKDLPRVMRLPGFVNHKEPKAQTALMDCDPDRVYDWEELRQIIPQQPRAKPSDDAQQRTGDYTGPDFAMAVECLKHLSARRADDYADWITIGQALHYVSGASPIGLTAWEEFSKRSEKFNNGECAAKWATFNSDRPNAVGLKRLLVWAQEDGGFSPPRNESDGTNRESTIVSSPDPTELALAQALQRQHGEDIRWNADRGVYFIWAGTHWTEDITGQVNRWAKTVARSTRSLFENASTRELTNAVKRMESSAGINGILALLRSEPGVTVRAADFDRDPMLLNVANGTLDLRTSRLRAFERANLISRLLPTRYDDSADTPRWQGFLNRVMNDNAELIGYLRRVAGLCLTGDISVQELFIFHGVGANGKSVFIDTLCELLGDYAGTAPDSLLIARHHSEHPTEIADLAGKRCVVASETEEGGRLRLQLVKKLTGDSRLKARFMRQDFFEFDRTHKLILVTNNRPRVSENTEAAWRRIRLVPFNVVIPPQERDLNLIAKLRDEYAGILAWCVRGCLEWQRNGMQPPGEVLVATDEYRSESDAFGEYVSERLICFDGARVTRTDLWCDYKEWASTDPLDRRAFYNRIRQLDGVTEAVTDGVRRFDGIGLCRSAYKGSAVE